MANLREREISNERVFSDPREAVSALTAELKRGRELKDLREVSFSFKGVSDKEQGKHVTATVAAIAKANVANGGSASEYAMEVGPALNKLEAVLDSAKNKPEVRQATTKLEQVLDDNGEIETAWVGYDQGRREAIRLLSAAGLAIMVAGCSPRVETATPATQEVYPTAIPQVTETIEETVAPTQQATTEASPTPIPPTETPATPETPEVLEVPIGNELLPGESRGMTEEELQLLRDGVENEHFQPVNGYVFRTPGDENNPDGILVAIVGDAHFQYGDWQEADPRDPSVMRGINTSVLDTGLARAGDDWQDFGGLYVVYQTTDTDAPAEIIHNDGGGLMSNFRIANPDLLPNTKIGIRSMSIEEAINKARVDYAVDYLPGMSYYTSADVLSMIYITEQPSGSRESKLRTSPVFSTDSFWMSTRLNGYMVHTVFVANP